MPQLSVAAVARKLGIAPATLRTWDRRYGIGPAHHAPGEHRRYSADDVARLELMRDALLHGATPAAAARYALSTPLPHSDPPPIPDTDEITLPTGRGGPGLPLPDAGWHARGLARAATALDADAVRRLLNESIAAVGAQITWDLTVRPVLVAIAQRWADTGTGIEIEHLLSDCVTAVFSALAASTPTTTARPVLLAGMAGDQHQLPIVVLTATLAAARCDVPVTGHRPACGCAGRSHPPHRTRCAAAVVATGGHRRSRPADVASPHPTRLQDLHRRPRMGGRRRRTESRPVEFASRGDRRHQRGGIDPSAAPTGSVAGPWCGRMDLVDSTDFVESGSGPAATTPRSTRAAISASA